VLVDSGLYAYNCGGAWEAHFRETAAHNTAKVDDADQARHIRKMAWSHSYRVTIEASGTGDHPWCVAWHDGFARGAQGVIHRRAVWRRAPSYMVIYDEFVGDGEHTLEVNFQFAPGDLHLRHETAASFSNFADMTWVSDAAWTTELRCGGESPADGWICPSLGVRRPAPRLSMRARTAGHRTALLTIVSDRSVAHCASVASVPGAILVSAESWADLVVAPSLSRGGPMLADGYVAVCRVDERGEQERSAAGGTVRHVDAQWLMDAWRSLRRER
jgi:hypothetical protein